MQWDVIRPALLSVVQTCTTLTGAGACAWKGSKDDAGFRPAIVARLSLAGGQGVGTDELRGTYNPTTQLKDLTVAGPRQFSMTVRIETQNQTDAGIAQVYADRLRARLNRQSIVDQLHAAGVAVATVQPTQVLENIVVEGRLVSVAIVEVVFNSAENDTDDTAGAGNWIQKMTGQSQFWKDPDGNNSADQSDIEVNT